MSQKPYISKKLQSHLDALEINKNSGTYQSAYEVLAVKVDATENEIQRA